MKDVGLICSVARRISCERAARVEEYSGKPNKRLNHLTTNLLFAIATLQSQ
jgi:hypothetical protein